MRKAILMIVSLLALAACTTTTPATEAATATLPAPSATPTEAPTPTTAPPTPTPRLARYTPQEPDHICEPTEARACAVLFVVAQTYFNYGEYQRRSDFEQLGYTVSLAAGSMEPAMGYTYGREHYVQPNLTTADVDMANYDAVVFVGGDGAGSLLEDAHAVQIPRLALDMGKVLGGQCNAVTFLAQIGVLDDKTIVTPPFPGYCAGLEERIGVTCAPGGVARDGAIITASTNEKGLVWGVIEAIEELLP